MSRILDIIFASTAIIFLLPLFFPIMLILKCTGEGEIFFRQERIGKNGKRFYLLKFATMLKDSPNIGTGTITIKDDPRVLPFGALLRKSKVNELPQLLNIIQGDMSFIGPRPLTSQTFSYYSEETQSKVTQVRPGLSGIGSIVFRDEEDLMQNKETSKLFYNDVIAPYKGKLEEWYINNEGIKLYFTAILLTIICVIFPKTKIPWKWLKNLPKPPKSLAKWL